MSHRVHRHDVATWLSLNTGNKTVYLPLDRHLGHRQLHNCIIADNIGEILCFMFHLNWQKRTSLVSLALTAVKVRSYPPRNSLSRNR